MKGEKMNELKTLFTPTDMQGNRLKMHITAKDCSSLKKTVWVLINKRRSYRRK